MVAGSSRGSAGAPLSRSEIVSAAAATKAVTAADQGQIHLTGLQNALGPLAGLVGADR